jgi:hypothetical protein
MKTQKVFISQFHAALEMLHQALMNCPDTLWDDSADKNKFWHLAYHALFYTHLYLHPSGQDFIPWTKHRENYNVMDGRLPWPPHDPVQIGEAYTRAEVLEFWRVCYAAVDEMLVRIDLSSESSGFDWIPMSKLELQLYNLRHLQQHTGELMERLGSRAGIDIDWVGSKAE